jgi:predicted RNase H-like HicB family nuclease
MLIDFRLEYWIEDDWYIGHLKDVPGVFSQGENLKELQENIKDAYYMMRTSNEADFSIDSQITNIGINV